MKQETNKNKTLFFAYQGQREGAYSENVDAIRSAVKDFNHYQQSYQAISWESLKKSGTIIDKEIIEQIDICEIFACDLSFLNHNVLFELGYAIAKNKNLFIFLNESINGSKENYNDFILNKIKYTNFKNSKEILSALRSKDYSNEHINKYIQLEKIQEKSDDIFYIECSSESQASIDLTSYIESLRDYKENLIINSSDSSEVEYQTLSYYFTNLAKSNSVIIHMLAANKENCYKENAEKSFYAGVAYGLNRNVLIVAPAKFKAPLDYDDILIDYASSTECIDKVEKWIKNNVIPLKTSTNKEIFDSNTEENQKINLLKIALECVAENEKNTLSEYFIETNSYVAALNNQSKLIMIGRKGAGKTAIYIKLLEDLSKDKLNYIVSLKPDSEELLENVDLSTLYTGEGSKKTFFYSVWKTVIYSKLLQLLCDQINIKILSSTNYQLTKEEKNILDFAKENEDYLKLNFFGVMKKINEKVNNANQINTPDVLQDLYVNYIGPLANYLKEYFKDKKYHKIILLADNLDKTWNSKSDLSLQSEMIFSLLEVDNKIRHDLNCKDTNIKILSYIFLREDIANYIFKEANEPDKLITFTHRINWEEYPGKLKKLIEVRFNHILGAEINSDELWNNYFDFGKNKPFELIKRIIIPRPRDIIYFVNKIFESAFNNDHTKANKDDLEYATIEYSKFLNGNLIAEMKAEYHNIADLLSKLQENGNIGYDKIRNIISQFGYSDNKIDDLIDSLFKQKYLVGFDKSSKKVFREYKELKRELNKKRHWFFKPKINMVINSKYLDINRFYLRILLH